MKRYSSCSFLISFVAAVITAASISPMVLAQSGTGQVRGVVTDATGRAFIEEAAVTMAGKGLAARTDRRGEFLLTGLAPGDYALEVNYTGMRPKMVTVRVVADETTSLSVRLEEDVVAMGPYSVVVNRSADALALTQQRNAANVKNVVDIESYGKLNNDNPAELLQLLPGVFGSFFGGEVDRVTIRGFDSALNNVLLDGNPMATPTINGAATDRSSILSTTSASNIKTAEVVKALTPDRSADAIGGMVNLIQRTALDYPKSAGRFNYTAGGKYVTTNSGWDTEVTPSAQLTFHDAFGAQRNWGVYVTGGINDESTNQRNTNQALINNATFGFIPNLFASGESERIRERRNWATTVNYRPNSDHEIILKYKHDEWSEETESLVSQLTPASPTAAWTHDVRTYNSGSFVINHPHNPAEVATNSISLEGNDRFGPWETNYSVYTSRSISRVAADKRDDFGTTLATLLTSVRFTYVVDSTQDFSFPSRRITSTNEDAVYNPDNFTLGTFQQANFYTDDQRKGGRFDIKRAFDWPRAFTLKAGGAKDEQSRLRRQRNNTHQFLGEDRVLGVNAATGVSDDRLSRFVDPNPPVSGLDAAGNRRPFFLDIAKIARSYREQPQLWTDDVYTNLVNSMVNNFQASEEVDAAYVMGETEISRLRLLGGVRWERTQVEGLGVFRNPVQATAAQIPDPVQRAKNNAGGTLRRASNYDDWFPSIHATYSLRPDLLVRASYSTGIGRQAYSAIIPTTTINDNARTVTTNNVGLEPEHADSFDLSAEFYLKPAGIVSVGLFRKEIRDYVVNTISTVDANNPFGPQYVGYELRTAANGGTAMIDGFEFNYIQQLNFIPRQFGLVTAKGNLTVISAKGDFGETSLVTSSRVPNFVPRAWNLVCEYTLGRFYGLARYNRQASFLVTAGANPRQDNISAAREKLDLNLVYRWREACEFFVAIDNVTKQPTALRYWGTEDNPFAGQIFEQQRRFNFGVQGKF